MKVRIALFSCALLLVACGGGSGGGTAPPAPLPILAGKLAYVDNASGKDRLFIADDSGGRNAREIAIRQITVLSPHDAGDANLQPNQIVSIGPPVWSNDGTKLALVVSRAENQSQVIVLDPETGNAFTASPQSGDVKNPDFTPDGQSIAYIVADQGFQNPRLGTTVLSTGEVREFSQTAGLEITAHRWDQTSTGLYYFVATSGTCAQFLLDVQSNNQTCVVGTQTTKSDTLSYEPGLPQDLTRAGAGVWGEVDPEFTALIYYELGADHSNPVKAGTGLFYGWFLPSSDLMIGVEELGSERKPPLIARFDPRSDPHGDRFKEFGVRAPVALKWDFYAAANSGSMR